MAASRRGVRTPSARMLTIVLRLWDAPPQLAPGVPAVERSGARCNGSKRSNTARASVRAILPTPFGPNWENPRPRRL